MVPGKMIAWGGQASEQALFWIYSTYFEAETISTKASKLRHDKANMTCHHKSPSLTIAIVYALSLATAFVLNLYLLVPKAVSKLPRSNVQQIKWRIFSVFATFSIALSTYPSFFLECDDVQDDVNLYNFTAIMSMLQVDRAAFVPVLHVMILYLGSFITSLLQLKLAHMTMTTTNQSTASIHNNEKTLSSFISHRIMQSIRRPFLNPWQAGRDLFVAPLAEEIIFRVCIIPPFAHSGTMRMGTAAICWLTPLFFGLAHVHHAATKLKSGGQWKGVLLGTLFQMTYTMLFGAYASYCFVKLGSLTGIVLVHSFCNFMGLPNLALFFVPIQRRANMRNLEKTMRAFRIVSGVAYFIGVAGFIAGFRRYVGLFPEQGFLQSQIY